LPNTFLSEVDRKTPVSAGWEQGKTVSDGAVGKDEGEQIKAVLIKVFMDLAE